SRLKWVLFWRLCIAILALVAVIISQFPLKGTLFLQPRFLAAYIILTIACFSNIIYLVLLKMARRKLRTIALLQIGVDIILTSSLAYCTGGSASIFVSIYFALILAADILISAKVGLFFASVSAILLSLITIIYSFSAAGRFDLPLLPPDYVKNTAQGFRFIFPYLLFFTIIIHFVAYFVGRLVIALNYERLLKARILQNMNSGILVLAPSGKVLYANPPVQQMFGIKRSLLENTPTNMALSEFLDGAVRMNSQQKEKFLAFSQTFLNTEVTAIANQDSPKTDSQLPFTLNIPSSHNEERTLLEIKTSLLKSDDMQLKGFIIIINDITLKQKLEDISKQSEFLNSLREMSLSIAHEIRNPLTSVRGGVQEISNQLKSQLSADQHTLIKTIIKESERLNNLVGNFIDFTRDRKPTMQESDIVGIINEVVLLIRQAAPDGTVIKTDLPQNKIICDIDSEQIKQVLYNLIINSIESSTGKGPAPTKNKQECAISIKILKSTSPLPMSSRKGITIEITDCGKGIQPQHVNRIFEPFFTTKSEGIGLGLSIAKRIVENHGGNITVESKLDKGTTFSIWLPLN
ncbi:MAG TPA: ATP-binding protein, partial [Planctomycetota bacterium]|nr:ATP-binding protein [Planctomycetota bacterium]